MPLATLLLAATVYARGASLARSVAPDALQQPEPRLAILVDRRPADALAKAARKMIAGGRYLQAEPLLEKRLWRRQADEATTTPVQMGEALAELADLYALEGRLPEAEELYERAYDLLRPALGLEDPVVLGLQDHMAELYRLQGRLLRSEDLQKRVLEARERKLGVDHRDVGDSVDHLGRLLRDEGRFADAESLLKRALAVRARAFGERGAPSASTRHDLASLYAAQGRLELAESSYRQCLAQLQRQLGRRHPETLSAMTELAHVLRQVGQPTEAEALERAAAIGRALNARDVPAQ